MAEETANAAPTWSQHLSLYAYKLLCLVLRCCDVRLVACIGRGVGYLVWMAIPSRRRIVARNMRIVVDPTLRGKKLNALVRRNIVRTCMNLACSLKTGLMSEKEAARSIVMKGAEIFEAHGSGGRTVVSCIPHAGNWEILARIRPYFKKVEHFSSMYRKLSNPLLEDFVYRSRTRYGCEMYSKENGLKAVLSLARTGGLMGVLSDQFTQEGLFLPYFGKVTGVTPLPAILYKRCKGKGTLHAVFTRNTALGKWEAVLGRSIELPEGCDTLPAITMQVNLALEKCQKENIIDGFWMHHRWKSTNVFAPKQDAAVAAETAKYVRLPFRIIVAMPEEFEEAALLLPLLRTLKNCRTDVQLTVLCPSEQAELWSGMPEVTWVVATDGKVRAIDRLESDDLYKDGPYDMLYMFSESKKLMKQLNRLQPLRISGFAENPLAKKYRFGAKETVLHTGAPRHRIQAYVSLFEKHHKLEIDICNCVARGNAKASGCYIAPFSSLGQADSWPDERWAELIAMLPQKPVLLALKADEAKAASAAGKWGIERCCVQPHEVADVLGPHTHLYAVDGLLPQLAAMAGCPCTVLMASRLKEVYAPLGKGHRILFRHLPCHPCYRQDCDMPRHCTDEISAEDMLA